MAGEPRRRKEQHEEEPPSNNGNGCLASTCCCVGTGYQAGIWYVARGPLVGGVRVFPAGSVARLGGWGGAIGPVTDTPAHVHTRPQRTRSHSTNPHGWMTERQAHARETGAGVLDQASVNSGQTDIRRHTPEGGGTAGATNPPCHRNHNLLTRAPGHQGMHPSFQPTHPSDASLPPESTKCQRRWLVLCTVYRPLPMSTHGPGPHRRPVPQLRGAGAFPTHHQSLSSLTLLIHQSYLGGDQGPAPAPAIAASTATATATATASTRGTGSDGSDGSSGSDTSTPHLIPFLLPRGPQVALWGSKARSEA